MQKKRNYDALLVHIIRLTLLIGILTSITLSIKKSADQKRTAATQKFMMKNVLSNKNEFTHIKNTYNTLAFPNKSIQK